MAEIANTLDCMHDQQITVYDTTQITSPMNYSNPKTGDPCHPLAATAHVPLLVHQDRKYIVRRLTPLECCRLQGFPDWWTEGVEGSDSAQYKMWGNGMALPVILYIMQGMRDALVEGMLDRMLEDE